MKLDDIVAILKALERHNVDYAIIGAMAMAAHGLDRATRDLDIFVAPDSQNVARLRQALMDVFDDPDIEQITADDLGGDYPAIQYGPPDTTYTLDLVSRLGEAFSFKDLEVMTVLVQGQQMRVVTPRTLYEMKKDTVRGRDRDDAARLREAFDLEG